MRRPLRVPRILVVVGLAYVAGLILLGCAIRYGWWPWA